MILQVPSQTFSSKNLWDHGAHHRHTLCDHLTDNSPLVHMDEKLMMAMPRVTLRSITCDICHLLTCICLFVFKVNFFIFLKILKLLISKLKAHQMCFRDYKYRWVAQDQCLATQGDLDSRCWYHPCDGKGEPMYLILFSSLWPNNGPEAVHWRKYWFWLTVWESTVHHGWENLAEEAAHFHGSDSL